jgi:hypothetical protein
MATCGIPDFAALIRATHCLRVLVQQVMRGLDPRIHLLRKKVFAKMDGLHRNSGLPELRSIMRRKSGKPDLRCQARQ